MNKLPDISFLDLGGIEYLKYPYFLLKELEIPFLCVVDHDFFFGYKNGTLSQSRNPLTGFPEYDTELKNNDVINDLFPDTADKSALKTAHQNSYTQFFKFAANQNILPMRYCLEMDLVTSSQAAAKYYSLLNIMPVNQNQRHLLINCKKSIKNADNILSVVNSIQPIAYPYSFKKIRSAIINCINNTIE